jgi:hypothetical protein
VAGLRWKEVALSSFYFTSMLALMTDLWATIRGISFPVWNSPQALLNYETKRLTHSLVETEILTSRGSTFIAAKYSVHRNILEANFIARSALSNSRC